MPRAGCKRIQDRPPSTRGRHSSTLDLCLGRAVKGFRIDPLPLAVDTLPSFLMLPRQHEDSSRKTCRMRQASKPCCLSSQLNQPTTTRVHLFRTLSDSHLLLPYPSLLSILSSPRKPHLLVTTVIKPAARDHIVAYHRRNGSANNTWPGSGQRRLDGSNPSSPTPERVCDGRKQP